MEFEVKFPAHVCKQSTHELGAGLVVSADNSQQPIIQFRYTEDVDQATRFSQYFH